MFVSKGPRTVATAGDMTPEVSPMLHDSTPSNLSWPGRTPEYMDRRLRREAWYHKNLRLLKETQGCSRCGTHEGNFHHHHVDPSTKRFSVSDLAWVSLEFWLDEIAKCTVLCHSCHSKLHFSERDEEWLDTHHRRIPSGQWLNILDCWYGGQSQKSIAEDFACSQQNISRIIKNTQSLIERGIW